MFVDPISIQLNIDSCRFDLEKAPEHALYLDCFCVVATGIGVSPTIISYHDIYLFYSIVLNYVILLCTFQTDASGEKLKDLVIEMKLTPSAVDYIRNKTPDKGSEQHFII